MTNYLIIPGLGNSGPGHWQTWFESTDANFKRVNQKEWDVPDCNDWIKSINKAISYYDPANVILIGHSLGCATIANWARQTNALIKGALLVAPSDIEAPAYTFPATGFSPIPLEKFKFRSIVVASSDDHWVTLQRAEYFANCWGSEFINIGKAGHINADSGYGQWPRGLEILKMIG